MEKKYEQKLATKIKQILNKQSADKMFVLYTEHKTSLVDCVVYIPSMLDISIPQSNGCLKVDTASRLCKKLFAYPMLFNNISFTPVEHNIAFELSCPVENMNNTFQSLQVSTRDGKIDTKNLGAYRVISKVENGQYITTHEPISPDGDREI